MKLEDFNKEELIAIINQLSHNHIITDATGKTIRYGLEERARRLHIELEQTYDTDMDTLNQITALAKQYQDMPIKDIPPTDLDRLISLQDKLDKIQKRQTALRKRENECWNQIKATYERTEEL